MTINKLTKIIAKAAVSEQQMQLGIEVQKKFIPLNPVPSGEDRRLSTGHFTNDRIEFFGYYQGARGVSGDYFNYKQVDDDHYACIISDISGKHFLFLLHI